MFKKVGIIVVGVVFCFAVALAGAVSVDDVIKLHKEGLSPDVIKTFIQASGQVFELSADDILKLKKAGVTDDVIKLMLETQKKTQPQQTTPPPSNNPPPTITERLLGTPAAPARPVVEPTDPFVKKYNSMFQCAVYQKKKKFAAPQRIVKIGQYDPLRNSANRAGTLILTESAFVVYNELGDKKFETPYKEITALKVINRYPDEVEARFHPLDRYQLRIEFEREGKSHFLLLFALPAPENPDPNYGSVIDIANAIKELGGAVNPRLLEPKKKPQ